MRVIERLSRRRFHEGVLAEEASTYVIEQLSENNWQKCLAFQGKSQAQTFLHSLVLQLLEEFSRKRFGRPRPPAWLQRQGDLWVRVWKQLCIERQSKQAVTEQFSTQQQRSLNVINNIIRTIKARIPHCGQQSIEQVELSEDNSPIDNSSDETSRRDQYLVGEILLFLRSIEQSNLSEQSTVLSQDNASDSNTAQHIEKLRQDIQLSAQEKLLLRMIYIDGLNKKAASSALGMREYQAGRIVAKALARIQEAIKQYEIDMDSILSRL